MRSREFELYDLILFDNYLVVTIKEVESINFRLCDFVKGFIMKEKRLFFFVLISFFVGSIQAGGSILNSPLAHKLGKGALITAKGLGTIAASWIALKCFKIGVIDRNKDHPFKRVTLTYGSRRGIPRVSYDNSFPVILAASWSVIACALGYSFLKDIGLIDRKTNW